MKTLFFLQAISALTWPVEAWQDQAYELYDSGKTFMNLGQHKEALVNFEDVVTNFSETEWAPKSLLEIGSYYLTVEKDHEKALSYYTRIRKDYGQSDEAPAAYYFKALIIEQQSELSSDIQAGIADLIRMNRLFPKSQWRSEALFLFGKLHFRLQNYDQSLSYFQRLEFDFPQSKLVPQALLSMSISAYLNGSVQQASLILSRLQSQFPNTEEAETAAGYLRLLNRFRGETMTVEIDRSFFGSPPKRYSNPQRLGMSAEDSIAIEDSKGIYVSSTEDPADRQTFQDKDFSSFCTGTNGQLFLVYQSRIVNVDSSISFTGLSVDGDSLRDMRHAAFDSYQRLFVIDNGVKDLIAFSRKGTPIKQFSMNRPQMVRCFQSDIWVLNNDENVLIRYNSELTTTGDRITGYENVVDFQFDTFGNLYLLHDKGNQFTVISAQGKTHLNLALRGGGLPLKQAEAIAVDSSGAIYLSDRRGGSVFRFH